MRASIATPGPWLALSATPRVSARGTRSDAERERSASSDAWLRMASVGIRRESTDPLAGASRSPQRRPVFAQTRASQCFNQNATRAMRIYSVRKNVAPDPPPRRTIFTAYKGDYPAPLWNSVRCMGKGKVVSGSTRAWVFLPSPAASKGLRSRWWWGRGPGLRRDR